MHIEHGHIVGDEVEARGAFLDRPVLAVLVTRLLLVCGVYLLLMIGHFG